jgi:hypothetical protein
VNSDWFSDSVASKEEGNEASSLLLNKEAYGDTNLHSSPYTQGNKMEDEIGGLEM